VRRVVKGERGFTLVELIVTVAILGIAFSVFLGGMSTSIIGSDYNRKTVTSDILLRRFAEAVKDSTYMPCPASYVSSFTAPSGFASYQQTIKYWNGTSYVASPCPSPDKGLELITLRVASQDGRDSETVEIVKRKP
jgi:prepilin-type N-terminal cleavage/methylation domain-containing protein